MMSGCFGCSKLVAIDHNWKKKTTIVVKFCVFENDEREEIASFKTTHTMINGDWVAMYTRS